MKVVLPIKIFILCLFFTACAVRLESPAQADVFSHAGFPDIPIQPDMRLFGERFSIKRSSFVFSNPTDEDSLSYNRKAWFYGKFGEDDLLEEGLLFAVRRFKFIPRRSGDDGGGSVSILPEYFRWVPNQISRGQEFYGDRYLFSVEATDADPYLEEGDAAFVRGLGVSFKGNYLIKGISKRVGRKNRVYAYYFLRNEAEPYKWLQSKAGYTPYQRSIFKDFQRGFEERLFRYFRD